MCSRYVEGLMHVGSDLAGSVDNTGGGVVLQHPLVPLPPTYSLQLHFIEKVSTKEMPYSSLSR